MDDLNIKDILNLYGFSFKKKLGQNFITDKNLLASIAEKAGIGKDDTVVEIGCGAGTLTRELCARAKKVVSFEVDEKLKPVLETTLAGVDNCEVVFKDFLKIRMDTFEKTLGEYQIVANLPYYITSPLIMQVVEHSKKCKSMTVLVQEEVAKRLTASPATAQYGAITAQIALRGTCEYKMRVLRHMFYPRPNVDSAVVKITLGEEISPFPEMYKACVKAAFSNRRKTLENNLVSSFSLTREMAKDIISSCNFKEDIRGERLSPKDFCLLAEKLQAIKGKA